MKTVTIPESEYAKMKQTIAELQQKLSLFQDEDFLLKLKLAYDVFIAQQSAPNSSNQPRLSLKRGSGKHLIKYMADDFAAPLEEFKDYM